VDETQTQETPAEAADPPEPLAPGERRRLVVFGVIALVGVVIAATLGVRSVREDKTTSTSPVGISGTPGTWKAGADAPGPTDGFVLTAGKRVIAGPKGPAGLNPWTTYVYDIAARAWTSYPGPVGVADRTPYARVWDGTEMLVFGGFLKHTSGHRGVFNFATDVWAFDPATGAWRLLKTTGSPWSAPQRAVQAVWTGQVVVVFAGGAAGDGPATTEFNPATGTWSPGYAQMPGGLRIAPAVTWTGGEVVAWGGVTDAKAAIHDPRAPRWHTAQATTLADGYAYSPATHKWTPIKGAPFSAVEPAAAWTGTDWMLYGGTQIKAGTQTPVPGGYSYDPGTDAWTALPSAPFQGLSGPVAVWNGDTYVLWGRDTGAAAAPKGAVYDPVATSWSSMDASSQNAGPGAVASWTGSSMLVVGGGTPAETKGRHTQHVAEWKPSS
jgi:hypothetical protein